LLPDRARTQGLRPGLQSVAAARLVHCGTDHCRGRCDGYHNAQKAISVFPKWRSKTPSKPQPRRGGIRQPRAQALG